MSNAIARLFRSHLAGRHLGLQLEAFCIVSSWLAQVYIVRSEMTSQVDLRGPVCLQCHSDVSRDQYYCIEYSFGKERESVLRKRKGRENRTVLQKRLSKLRKLERQRLSTLGFQERSKSAMRANGAKKTAMKAMLAMKAVKGDEGNEGNESSERTNLAGKGSEGSESKERNHNEAKNMKLMKRPVQLMKA